MRAIWRTGNKLPRAFGAHAQERTPRVSFPIFFKRHATRWWHSSSRSTWKRRGKVARPQNGTRQQPKDSADKIGRRKLKKRRSDWEVSQTAHQQRPRRRKSPPRKWLSLQSRPRHLSKPR